MDFVFWIILIVLIVGIVWWLLNRSSSTKATGDDGRAGSGPAAPAQGIRADGALAGGSAAASAEGAGTAGMATATGFGRPSEPVPPTTADETSELSEPSGAGRAAERDSSAPERTEAEAATAPAETLGAPSPPAGGNAEDVTAVPAHRFADDATSVHGGEAPERTGGLRGTETPQRTGPAQGTNDHLEWETQWSEAGGSPAPHATAATVAPTGEAGTADLEATVDADAAETKAASQAAPVHHPEYTAPHAPTLPGAESAAAEAGIDEPADAEPAGSSPVTSSLPDAETVPEPAGHLAADRPYGEGSASPAPDGSGPADYTVKGDAGSMVYYEEGHPEYEQTRAGVWFESAAHAEAAGFRAPRRTRLQ